MKKLVFLLTVSLLSAAALAEATGEAFNLVFRQRWPWSAKVDIDYSYRGNGHDDVVLTATWDGQAEPVELCAPALTGSRVFSVLPGANHLTWDPAVAGYGSAELKNFRVRATVVSAASRKYMVVNVSNGAITYQAEPPSAEDGGWTNVLYKTERLVLARIPSGTYRLGDESSVYTTLGAAFPKANVRTVTFTSDFYLGIFMLTMRQRYLIAGGTSYGGAWEVLPDVLQAVYSQMRGKQTDDPRVCWPTTGYYVSPDSILGKLRTKTGNRFLFDLPEEEQWEVAARCGTTTLWPEGGVITDARATLEAIASQTTLWAGHPDVASLKYSDWAPVGLLAPNAWGLYDMCGIVSESMLDVGANDADRPSVAVDPTGKAEGAEVTTRIARGGYRLGKQGATDLSKNLPSYRIYNSYSENENGYVAPRVAIHLNPLDFNVH